MSQDTQVDLKPVAPKRGAVGTLIHFAGLLVAGSIALTVIAALLGTVGWIGLCAWNGTLDVTVKSTEYVIVQYPIIGYMGVYTEPGSKLRLGGDTFHYPQVVDYNFSKSATKGGSGDESLKIRFADSGHGTLSGSCSFRLPSDKDTLLKLHKTYKSPEGVIHSLIRNTIENDVNMVGAMMTAREASQGKRPEITKYLYEFLKDGVPNTESFEQKTIDTVTKTEVKVQIAKVSTKDAGLAAPSPLKDFGVTPFGFSIDSLSFDERVEAQLSELQKIDMDVQKSILTSHKAQQDALTAKFEGQRAKEVADWKAQEASAKAVVEAEQKVKVAKANLEAADYDSQAEIKRATAKAQAISLVKKADILSDGGLSLQLNNKKEINEVWANAYSKRKVPTIQMSGGGNGREGGSDMDDLAKVLKLNALTDLQKKVEANVVLESDSVTPTKSTTK